MGYTISYSQPEEYHFSLDSILAAENIAHDLDTWVKDLEQIKALDICAGCGVLGFEVLFHRPELSWIDFIEIQNEYEKHFQTNKKLISSVIASANRHLELHLQNYESACSIEWREKYDLIVCNPPYFHLDQGRVPPNTVRRRSRFFSDSDFPSLIKTMSYTLKKNGRAYLLLRPLEDHGKSPLALLERVWSEHGAVQRLADIRGTNLIVLTKEK